VAQLPADPTAAPAAEANALPSAARVARPSQPRPH
jgi:hypothetical protein